MNKQYKEQLNRLHTSESFEENTIALLQKEARKEKTMFKAKTIKIILAAILAIILLSVTATAIVAHITSSDVATFYEDNALAEAFKSKEAKVINQTITTDEYTITLLGIVSGKQLTDWQAQGKLDTEKSYIAVMASYNDGKKMDYTLSEEEPEPFSDLHFTVAFDYAAPWMFPAEEYWPICIDGVAYYLIDSINLEPFANRNVKLFAYDKYTFPSGEIFYFNQETGKLTYNEKYNGVKAVFDLPLDKSKVNAEEAKQILSEWNIDDPYIYR